MPRSNPVDEDEEAEADVLEAGDEEDVSDAGDEGEGQDADEGGGEDEGAEEAEQGRRRDGVLKSKRGESSLQRISRQAQESTARADRLEREMAEMRAERQRQQVPAESPDQEAARLALMDPEQRSEYRLTKALARQEQQNNTLRFQMLDSSDKSAFASLCADKPLYKRFAAQVETKLADLRRQGQNVDREALAKYLIGEEVANRGPKVLQRQREQGKRNVDRQRAGSSATRSDQVRERAKQTAYERLKDVVIWD